jgi:hypothetical protein
MKFLSDFILVADEDEWSGFGGLWMGCVLFCWQGVVDFSMLLWAIIPVAITGHTFFPDEESMQRNHGCWQNH